MPSTSGPQTQQQMHSDAPASLSPDQLTLLLEDVHLDVRGRAPPSATRSTRKAPNMTPTEPLLQCNVSNTEVRAASAPTRQPLATLSLSNTYSLLNSQPRSNVTFIEKTRVSKQENLRRRAQWQPRIPSPRNPIQEPPVPLRVYFMPDGRYIHQNSIIHRQKRQNGFFLHPILVTHVDLNQGIAHFYALTSNPPDAIRDLLIYLRFGTTTTDEGENVLKLAEGSERMQQVTFANMEQLFRVEFQCLDYWRGKVAIDADEWAKIERKVSKLESEQNRYIYKPLQRTLKDVVPGIVLMLPNPPEASTLGAPILVLDVCYPHFRFLRIKEINSKGNMEGTDKTKHVRSLGLKLCRFPDQEHDPVLLFAPDSPEMRNPSYLECSRKVRWVHCDSVKTWSYPHVRISSASMNWLMEHLANLPEPQSFEPAPVIVRGPRAFPHVARIPQPQPPATFHPYGFSLAANHMYAQHGGWDTLTQHDALAIYGQQAATMVGHYIPPYNAYGPHMPQMARPPPPAYHTGRQYHHPQPSYPMAPTIGRTAYAASSTSTSATGFHTESSRSSTENENVEEV